MRHSYVVLSAVFVLCLLAFTIDMLGLFYGIGGVGGIVVLSMPVELLAVGLVCYVLGMLTTHLVFPILLAGVCVTRELSVINASMLQPLGQVSFCAFLFLLPVAAVIGFEIGGRK